MRGEPATRSLASLTAFENSFDTWSFSTSACTEAPYRWATKLIGTLPGRKPSALTVRESLRSRASISEAMDWAGRLSVMRRSSFSSVSTVTAMECVIVVVVRGAGLEPARR